MDDSWWLASDGKWYPATSHPNYQPPPRPDPPSPPEPDGPSGPTVIGTPGSGPAEVANRWQQGADGERATADALMKLPSTYRIIHGLKVGAGKGDIDHLVVGPTGVWVIDSKNDAGEFTAGNGTLWKGKYPISQKVESVEAQARYARFALGVDANPVLCFVQAKLPRPAQMVGRVRVVELDALAQHIMAGQTLMLPQHIEGTVGRVGAWISRPPIMPTSVPPVRPEPAPRSRSRRSGPPQSVPPASERGGSGNRRRRSPLTALVSGLIAIVLVVGACSVALVMAGKAAENLTERTRATTTTLVGAGYLKVDIDCPAPNGGHRMKPRSIAELGDEIRVSATINGAAQYLGQFRSYQPIEPIRGLAPNTTVGFDIQLVDDVGQGGPSYHLDITAPATPC